MHRMIMSVFRDKIEEALWDILNSIHNENGEGGMEDLNEMNGALEALTTGLPALIEKHGHNSDEVCGVQWLIERLTH